MKQICDYNKCTGCSACLNSCPKKCITMRENEYGVLVPYINQKECINCNICTRMCPENNEADFKLPKKIYASWSLDEATRKSSASGGIAYEMYKYVITNNGIAVGTQFDESFNLVHKIVDNINDIKNFKGSKYVQSYIGRTFEKIKELSEQNKKVIFIGTPCQVNGLKNYIKGKNTDNIIFVDLICHGVPPIKYLKEYLKYIEIDDKIDKISFRGENNWCLTGYKNEKIVYKKHNKEDFYYNGFLNGLFYRENCYNCRYARKERVGDITIGDFWGLGKEEKFEFSTEDGVSVILINSQKGLEFIDCLKDKLFLQERMLEEALKGNSQLNHSSYKNINTELFKELYKKHGFEEAIKGIKKGE